MHVVMLLYPGLTQLDLTGPFEVFARNPEMQLNLVWKTLDPVADGSGLRLLPTTRFDDAPQASILFVPGGPGQLPLMDDDATLDFLRRQAAEAQYITSVCTGSLILAAAGLLSGYRATCHWQWLSQLELLGAVPIAERVVEDRNRITGAGVSAGIDFALTLTQKLFGADRARIVQLSMEYDPDPPFDAGSPAKAGPETVAALEDRAADFRVRREAAARRVAARLRGTAG